MFFFMECTHIFLPSSLEKDFTDVSLGVEKKPAQNLNIIELFLNFEYLEKRLTDILVMYTISTSPKNLR